jgi:ribosomal protein S12 methylthiotransferase accessory factor
MHATDHAATKTFRHGTHRARTPDETLAHLRPLLPRFGITRVANLTGLDRTGIPVVTVCRPNARSSAVFHGKGVDLAAAKVSGLMEAIETWHAEHVALPLRFGSVAELRSACRVAAVESLPRASGNDLHDDLPMLWIEGQDLVSSQGLWLPFEVVHANSAIPGPPSSGCFATSTNGLASGNHKLEAISHALCEVIERDAMSLWRRLHATLQDRTRLALSTVGDPLCRAVLERIESAGLDVAAWDITTDVGVPAFQVVAIDRTEEIAHVGFGAGCHPASEIALLRALTEAVQVRTTYIVGSREDIEPADYRAATLEARRRAARALTRAEPVRPFDAIERFEFATFDSEVAWLLGRLTAVGLRQAIAVDLSRPETDIAVVRIVVPGLEGSHANPATLPGERARAIEARRPSENRA